MKESLPSWTYFSCLFSNCCSVYLSFPLFHFPNVLFVFNWQPQPSHLERETGGRVYRETNFGCFSPCSVQKVTMIKTRVCHRYPSPAANAFHSESFTTGPDIPSVHTLRSQMGVWDTKKASDRRPEAETQLRLPGSQIPTPSYVTGSSGSLSSWLWKLISYSFWNYLLRCLVHAQACVCACTHTLTLLHQGLMILKEFPYYILSFTRSRITRYWLWDGVSHVMVSSPTFLIDQDIAAPVFSHLHPDGNSLSTTNTHEASSACFSSLLEAETTQPGQCQYPDAYQSCQGAGSWWDSCPDGFGGGGGGPYSFTFTLGHKWKWTCIPQLIGQWVMALCWRRVDLD